MISKDIPDNLLKFRRKRVSAKNLTPLPKWGKSGAKWGKRSINGPPLPTPLLLLRRFNGVYLQIDTLTALTKILGKIRQNGTNSNNIEWRKRG